MYTRKHFTTSKSIVTIIVISLALVTSLVQAAPNKNIPVQVYFEDRSDDGIKSHGGQTYIDGESKVLAVIGRNNGQLWLDTNTSKKAGAGRTLSLDFGDQLLDENGDPAGGDPDAACPDTEWPLMPWPFASNSIVPESAEILTATPYSNYFVDLRDMTEGQSLSVALRIQFWFDDPLIGEDLWEISFGDSHPPNGTFPCRAPSDTTQPVMVRCITEVVEWEIEAPSSNLGAALHSVDYNGQTYWYGNYNMPFKITITTLASLKAPSAPNRLSRITATWGSIKAGH